MSFTTYDATKPLYTITVEAGCDQEAFAEDKTHSWNLDFVVEFQTGPKFEFSMWEPYLVIDKLRKMAAGEDVFIGCYMGNGEGSIELRKGEVIFVAHPSGAGGDVTSKFAVPSIEVLAALRKEFIHIDKMFYT